MDHTHETCTFEGCEKPQRAKTLCKGHYEQLRNGKELHPLRRRTPKGSTNCTFDGCNRPYYATGLCKAHWLQRDGGKPLHSLNLGEEERFFRKIMVNRETGCWNFQKLDKDGYGKFSPVNYKDKKSVLAHRWSYEYHNGTVLRPEDSIDHLCINRACVNPDHLERVSQRENTKRMLAHRALRSENERLRAFVEGLGYDTDAVLGL